MSEGLSRMEIKPLDFVNGTIKPRTIRDTKKNKYNIYTELNTNKRATIKANVT